jgi:hypothetical protein
LGGAISETVLREALAPTATTESPKKKPLSAKCSLDRSDLLPGLHRRLSHRIDIDYLALTMNKDLARLQERTGEAEYGRGQRPLTSMRAAGVSQVITTPPDPAPRAEAHELKIAPISHSM